MGFIRVRPQLVRHTDGYTVGGKDRETLSYKDEEGEVTIYIDRSPTGSTLYPKTMKRLSAYGQSSELTPEEKAIIFPRILAGYKAMSSSPVEVAEQ